MPVCIITGQTHTQTDSMLDLQVDVWALGISAVEMAEVADRDRWSLTFHDFVAQCLQKVPPLPSPSRTHEAVTTVCG